MIEELIRAVVEGRDLTVDESTQAMNDVMGGEATPAQIAAFIVALRMKGETADEITGCAVCMRSKAQRIDPGPSRYDVADTCGTGGDGHGTFNISTCAAIIAAGAGVTVAKHGNRAVSSKSGSADVLKELGVNIDADVPSVERCLREAHIGFLFAPRMHGAMKHAIGPRREIGIRTVFNILGPLTNPAGAKCQVLGVYDAKLAPLMADVLRKLGSKRCLVVHGEDGLDEITITGKTQVFEVRDGQIASATLDPTDFGLPRAGLSDLVVGSIAEAADVIRKVLAGELGPARDVVLMNAGAAVMVAGAVEDLAGGIRVAAETIDSGAAKEALERLVRVSNETAQ